MKGLLRNLLWPLALIACPGSFLLAAVAPLPLAHPVTQVTTCRPNLLIESVKYLGKNNGKDSVQVVFNGLAPIISSGGLNTPNSLGSGFNNTQFSCATYGVPSVAQADFQSGVSSNPSAQQNLGGGIGASPGFGYELTVTIMRKLGHQDTGTAKSSSIFNGEITTVVQIPRGVAETDPVSYDVTINTTFGGLTHRTLTAQGNGAPALASATQTFANSSLVPLPDNCFPSVSIIGLSFAAGSGATPDAVTVNWTANHSPSDCFTRLTVFISVDVKRADNSTGHASTQPNGTSVTMNLSGARAAPVSFIVRVSAETSLGQQFQVNKKGDF